MTHYTISYKNLPRHEADAEAVRDIQDYLTDKQWQTIIGLLLDPEVSIQQLNFAFALTGVSGYPFHAICRTFKLEQYRAWMEGGDDPVPVDEEGFERKEGA